LPPGSAELAKIGSAELAKIGSTELVEIGRADMRYLPAGGPLPGAGGRERIRVAGPTAAQADAALYRGGWRHLAE
jgi:hypothetical protein